MEDKKITELESLDLITKMIRQSNDHMACGAGNQFILWGVILVAISLIVDLGIMLVPSGLWMWGYFGIPVLGFPLSYWLQKRAKPSSEGHVKTYINNSIDKVWSACGKVLLVFPLVVLLLHSTLSPRVWIAMFYIGMFIPAIGCYITGIFLDDKRIQLFSGFACGMSLIFLAYAVQQNFEFTLLKTYIFPLCSFCSLVMTGILINRRAKAEK